jgi:peptide/nickel transport system permease protein
MTVAPGQSELVEAADLDAEPTAVDGAVAIQGRSPLEIVRGRIRRDKVTLVAFAASVIFVVLAASSPLLDRIGLLDPESTNTGLLDNNNYSLPKGTFGGISASHWLGVEPGTGRDLLSRVITGTTTSMLVATLATLFAVVVGTVLGIVSGYARGRLDWFIGRLNDLVLSFPQTLMLLSLGPVLTGRIATLLHVPTADNKAKIAFMSLVLGVFGFPFFARIIRGQVLSLREREFIEAARSLGARNGRIYFKELLPHLWAPLLVYTTLVLPANIAAEAGLGFLGVGIQAPTASLGAILNDSVQYAQSDAAYFIVPGFAVFLLVLSFNLLGDGLRDALDPKAGRS